MHGYIRVPKGVHPAPVVVAFHGTNAVKKSALVGRVCWSADWPSSLSTGRAWKNVESTPDGG